MRKGILFLVSMCCALAIGAFAPMAVNADCGVPEYSILLQFEGDSKTCCPSGTKVGESNNCPGNDEWACWWECTVIPPYYESCLGASETLMCVDCQVTIKYFENKECSEQEGECHNSVWLTSTFSGKRVVYCPNGGEGPETAFYNGIYDLFDHASSIPTINP
jgi:hypothetical protein